MKKETRDAINYMDDLFEVEVIPAKFIDADVIELSVSTNGSSYMTFRIYTEGQRKAIIKALQAARVPKEAK